MIRACRVFVLGMLLAGSIAASIPASSKSPREAPSNSSDVAVSEPRSFPVNQLPPLTHSSKKYTPYLDKVNFYKAWQNCIRHGKRLATIESYADHKAIREAIAAFATPAVTFWTAGTNLGAKSAEMTKYYWITNDRPVGYLSGFENWIAGSVFGILNTCIAIYLPSALWFDGDCTSNSYYVCEESQNA